MEANETNVANSQPKIIDISSAEAEQIVTGLAKVGNAIKQLSNDTNFQTDYFLAKEALNEIDQSVDKTHLSEEVKVGIHKLAEYLKGKIEKRQKADITGGPLDPVL